MRLCRHKRRYHYPREALGKNYEVFDVVMPRWSSKTYTSAAPGSNVSDSRIASPSAQAVEAFNRLPDHEKRKVLAYLCAGHQHQAVEETEGEELQKLTVLAMIPLLFAFFFYLAWAATVSAIH